MAVQILLGFILSLLIGLAGYARASLSLSGVVGAVLTGTIIFGFGGVVPGILLIAFFVSSSLLSHYRSRVKENLADKFQKGSRRDLGQALANAGWACILIWLYAFTSAPALFAAFAGSLAAVTADTWATELGVLSAGPPRLITTGRAVAVGTSGGVTLFGIAVSLLGGLFIGAVSALGLFLLSLFGLSRPLLPDGTTSDAFSTLALILAGLLAGLLGSLFDSLLGATVQTMYYCDRCGRETEKRVHSCGQATRRIRGWRIMDNDTVNFLASIFGSVVALAVWLLVI